jgi:hypothetical protein
MLIMSGKYCACVTNISGGSLISGSCQDITMSIGAYKIARFKFTAGSGGGNVVISAQEGCCSGPGCSSGTAYGGTISSPISKC